MTTHPNCKIQLYEIAKKMSGIGESKYAAKTSYRNACEERGEKWNPSKTSSIHSIITDKGYRQTINEFCNWVKENKSDIYATKDLNNFTKELCYEYLQYRNIKSAWTVTKDQSALNKVFNYDLNKKEGNLRERRQEDVTRSRLPRDMDTRYNPKNYSDAIDFAKAFGLRRESIKGGDYQVKESSLFTKQGSVYCSVIEKGGRYREAPCLKKYQDAMLEKYNILERETFVRERFTQTFTDSNKTEIIHPTIMDKQGFKNFYRASEDKPLFPKYTALIDNHAFRGEYARALYIQLVEAKESQPPDPNQKFYKGYLEDCVQGVSDALGHGRLSVVVISYFH